MQQKKHLHFSLSKKLVKDSLAGCLLLFNSNCQIYAIPVNEYVSVDKK